MDDGHLQRLLQLDRQAPATLTEQIGGAIRAAIREGRLRPGARLPSWNDLSAQLGVARGTVRAAYERLVDEQLVTSNGAAGTHVASQPFVAPRSRAAVAAPALSDMPFPRNTASADIFQIGVPAQDAFPYQAWSRLMARAARDAALAPIGYPDPRGEPALREEIAGYLAVARGLACSPAQILVTNGYAGALGLLVHSLRLGGTTAWVEEPGYPATRRALAIAGITPSPVRVDAQGLDVAAGIAAAPHAALAIVTPGQQAPLGVTLSLARRHALLVWAAKAGAWIVEDDYMGELQLRGRAAPALASLDRAGRVIHVGTFSKTICPALRLGFVVVPAPLAGSCAEAAAALAPAPAPAVQRAVAEFMRSGQYLRHLRRMKRIYAERRQALAAHLGSLAVPHVQAGLALLLRVADDLRDTDIAERAHAQGLSPVPLSPWYITERHRRNGLLLGVTNVAASRVGESCTRLLGLLAP